MNRIEKIFVTGTPKPQGRPRAFRRGKHVGVFSPTTEWKEAIKFQARNISQLNGALEISIDYFFNRPKSNYGTGRNADKLKDSAPKHMTKKPDLDNLNKAILDALQDVKAIGDDSSVVFLHSYKSYIGKDEIEGAEITIQELR